MREKVPERFVYFAQCSFDVFKEDSLVYVFGVQSARFCVEIYFIIIIVPHWKNWCLVGQYSSSRVGPF